MVRKPDSAPCGNFLAGVTRGWRAAKMTKVLDPFRFVLITVAGWMNQRQLQMIDYLREENRILREQLAGRRLRLNDDQRGRLIRKSIVITLVRSSPESHVQNVCTVLRST